MRGSAQRRAAPRAHSASVGSRATGHALAPAPSATARASAALRQGGSDGSKGGDDLRTKGGDDGNTSTSGAAPPPPEPPGPEPDAAEAAGAAGAAEAAEAARREGEGGGEWDAVRARERWESARCSETASTC